MAYSRDTYRNGICALISEREIETNASLGDRMRAPSPLHELLQGKHEMEIWLKKSTIDQLKECDYYKMDSQEFKIIKFVREYKFVTAVLIGMTDKIKLIWLNGTGQTHSFNDEPCVKCKINGGITLSWHKNNAIHRKKYVAKIFFDAYFTVQMWARHNELYRDSDQPHVFTTWRNGHYSVSWANNYGYHRRNKPAHYYFAPDGSLEHEGWFINGVAHRYGYPARTAYFANHVTHTYMEHGVELPAKIARIKNGCMAK